MNSGGDSIVLHADRHVLDRVVLALMRELEPAIAADAEADILEPRPGIVAVAEQKARLDAHAVANAEGLGGRPRDVLLDVFQMDVDGGMSAGAVPVLEYVGMAVDDHSRHLRNNIGTRKRRNHAPPSLSM